MKRMGKKKEKEEGKKRGKKGGKDKIHSRTRNWCEFSTVQASQRQLGRRMRKRAKENKDFFLFFIK